MSGFYEFVENYMGVPECLSNKKYSDVGHTFCVNNDEVEGLYWFYETEHFIVDIHDFFIKKELMLSEMPYMGDFVSLSSSYIISASGESFNPYQTLTSNSLYVLNTRSMDNNYRFLLHEKTPFLTVSINYKDKIIADHLPSVKKDFDISYFDIFSNTKSIITNSLELLARDILNCHMTSPAAEIFFEAKAKEWTSIAINAFLSRKEIKISMDDDKALENVASYIEDHYAIDISQKTLEKIAMMSGTKLKKLFKEKYQSSITEYTQRKRMNMAENLLLNSSLKVKDIAEAVGYSSHSKFSTCFKKFKGVYPKDIKKYSSKISSISKCICDKAENNVKYKQKL
ncbi:MAG: AraC family transcriptional regulator [Eubacterium sp.]|nr:AraC family transcriptional regulator [Eubacterium sp.]